MKSKFDNSFKQVPKYVEYETAEDLLNKVRKEILDIPREGRFSASPKRITVPLIPLFFPSKGNNS